MSKILNKILLIAVLLISFFSMNLKEVISQPPPDPNPSEYKQRGWEMLNTHIPKFNPTITCDCDCDEMFEAKYNWTQNNNNINLNAGHDIDGNDCHKLTFKVRNCSEEGITGIKFKFPDITPEPPCLNNSFTVIKKNTTGPNTTLLNGLFDNTSFNFPLGQTIENCATAEFDLYICRPHWSMMEPCWFESVNIKIEIIFDDQSAGCPELDYNILFDGISGIVSQDSSGIKSNDNQKHILFPNPLQNNEINIKNIEQLVNNKEIEVNLLNNTGNIIYSGTFNKSNINNFKLPNLEIGNYYFIIKDNKEIIFKEIINVEK